MTGRFDPKAHRFLNKRVRRRGGSQDEDNIGITICANGTEYMMPRDEAAELAAMIMGVVEEEPCPDCGEFHKGPCEVAGAWFLTLSEAEQVRFIDELLAELGIVRSLPLWEPAMDRRPRT
ncbi:MAG: hypothetical protein WDN04_13635 [Rhodospirillales bacterium]